MDFQLHGNFDEFGFPFLTLEIINPHTEARETAKAIIDTGAGHCMIQQEVSNRLSLPRLRIADYSHPVFGKIQVQEYTLDIEFESENKDGARIRNIRAGTMLDPSYPASLIIGVELLKECKFEYDGWNKKFFLTLKPSLE